LAICDFLKKTITISERDTRGAKKNLVLFGNTTMAVSSRKKNLPGEKQGTGGGKTRVRTKLYCLWVWFSWGSLKKGTHHRLTEWLQAIVSLWGKSCLIKGGEKFCTVAWGIRCLIGSSTTREIRWGEKMSEFILERT